MKVKELLVMLAESEVEDDDVIMIGLDDIGGMRIHIAQITLVPANRGCPRRALIKLVQ